MAVTVLALIVATAVHAGFQLTVTQLVYPALARTEAGAWTATHAQHSRRITPLVVVVYGAALVACAAVLWTGPRPAGVWVAVAGTAVAFTVTAAVAAPTHGALGRGRDPRLLRRLLRADRVRCVAALVALAGAVAAAWP